MTNKDRNLEDRTIRKSETPKPQSKFRRENGSYLENETALPHLDGTDEKGEDLYTGISQVSVIEDKVGSKLIFDYGSHEVHKGIYDYLAEQAFRSIYEKIVKPLKSQIYKHKILAHEEDIPMINMDYLFGSPTYVEGIDKDGNVTNDPKEAVKDKTVFGSDPTHFKDLDRIVEEGAKRPSTRQFETLRSQIAEIRTTMHPRIKEFFDGYMNNYLFDKQDQVSSEEVIKKG